VSEPYSSRRSIYGYIDRADVPDLLAQFDFANPNEPNTRRSSTIVPQQSLFLMNSPFTIVIIRHIMNRPRCRLPLRRVSKREFMRSSRVVLQRTPSEIEMRKALSFLRTEKEEQGGIEKSQKALLGTAQKRANEILASAQNRAVVDARAAVVNKGQAVERKVLNPWETMVQALLFCNEAMYLK